jgi:hypothetical protein
MLDEKSPSDSEWQNRLVEFAMIFQKFLKKTSVSLGFIVYLHKNISAKIVFL